AYGDQAGGLVVPVQRVEHRRLQAGAGHAEGVAHGDGAAVDVELVPVDAEVLGRRHDLGGERLVDLDQVDVVDRHAGVLQRALARLDGAHAHDLGGEARDAGGDDARERGEPELGGLRVGHDDDRGGAIVERAAVACGHDAVGTEDRVELGDRVVGDAGARAVVGGDDRAVGQRDRGDL